MEEDQKPSAGMDDPTKKEADATTAMATPSHASGEGMVDFLAFSSDNTDPANAPGMAEHNDIAAAAAIGAPPSSSSGDDVDFWGCSDASTAVAAVTVKEEPSMPKHSPDVVGQPDLLDLGAPEDVSTTTTTTTRTTPNLVEEDHHRPFDPPPENDTTEGGESPSALLVPSTDPSIDQPSVTPFESISTTPPQDGGPGVPPAAPLEGDCGPDAGGHPSMGVADQDPAALVPSDPPNGVEAEAPPAAATSNHIIATELAVPSEAAEPGRHVGEPAGPSSDHPSSATNAPASEDAAAPPSALKDLEGVSPSASDNNYTNHHVDEDAFALKARVAALETELAEARAQAARRNEETSGLLAELQDSLQAQMGAKAEAENRARLLDVQLRHLQDVSDKQSGELANLADLQSVLQEHLESKAEAEQATRRETLRATELEQTVQAQAAQLESMEAQLHELREEKDAQLKLAQSLRAERDEHHRREKALTSRLNSAKKEQAEQSNLAERYDDEIKALEQDLEATKKDVAELSQAKVLLENELEVTKKTSENRIRQAESALLEERNLNEERKRKMKVFVEHKSEELRQVKSDNDALQAEVTQANKSLLDLNGRWKQLHAQWVQSQTRNRELQRDLNRIKKDSETLHRVGDTLEMKLSRSATETEEHKNKRLAAKHELMTVLRALEAERELSTKLRDSLKFTFTPKALSQQQLLSEGLQDFEGQLQKLAARLGRTLPSSTETEHSVNSDLGEHGDAGPGPDGMDLVNGGDDGMHANRTDVEVQRLIAKLEYETQRVSQGIMALSGSIERMNVLLDISGDRTCYTVLSELLTTGTLRATSTPVAASEETQRLGVIRSSSHHQYGHIPSAVRD